MALARIISNSDLCSRELAINLLERGYAVEIVTPDAIPDNIADLEVRVETGPADLLSASVEVRGGSHSSTLQFIHQLKSPSLDMKRPAPLVVPEEAIPDVTIPALAIPVNPSQTNDLVAVSDATVPDIAIPALAIRANLPQTTELIAVSDVPIADITNPALAIPANLPQTTELIAVSDVPIAEIMNPALAIAANPPRTAVPCEPIPISKTALATAIKPRIVEALDVIVEPMSKPLVVEKPEIILAPMGSAPGEESADPLKKDPPKKPAAFTEGASVIALPSQSESSAPKNEQLATPDVVIPASPAFKLIIPKPSIPSFTIPKLDLSSWQALFRKQMRWVRTVRPPSWFGGAALGFAGVMALGLALELGSARMNLNPRNLGSGVATAENGAAINTFSLPANAADGGEDTTRGTDAKLSTLGQSLQQKPSAVQVAPPPRQNNSTHSAASSKLHTSARPTKMAKVVPKSKVARHSDDVAPDTITYFNRSGAKPIPVEQLTRQGADSRKRGGTGVVAANSAPSKTVSTTGSGK